MSREELTTIMVNQARLLNASLDGTNFNGHRYKIFSQWDEDGIIQYLVDKINPSKFFVEIGVEDYTECNTRLLNLKDGWRGLVVEQDSDSCKTIMGHHEFWRWGLDVINETVTAENINQLLKARHLPDVGLLSIDVDGNDYWIWKSIVCINAAIVICEYNAIFGPDLHVSVPYDPTFERGSIHHSNLYAGTSLSALIELGSEKGYIFVGCNSGFNNAVFVRADLVVDGIDVENISVFREPNFRESRDSDGNLTMLSLLEGRSLLLDMPLVETKSRRISLFGELLRKRKLGFGKELRGGHEIAQHVTLFGFHFPETSGIWTKCTQAKLCLELDNKFYEEGGCITLVFSEIASEELSRRTVVSSPCAIFDISIEAKDGDTVCIVSVPPASACAIDLDLRTDSLTVPESEKFRRALGTYLKYIKIDVR